MLRQQRGNHHRALRAFCQRFLHLMAIFPRHHSQMLYLSSIHGYGINRALYSCPVVMKRIRMRCRAQNALDANVIQLLRDLPQKPVCARSMNLSAPGRFNRSPTRLGGFAQPSS
jgi:hypothetical protein